VILRLGGVYADIDVECKQPLDSIILASDTLLAGWDSELVQPQLAAQQGFPRQRQLASWFFAAAPGHPVLRQLCDHIAHHARTVFANSSVRDTQERTGQGVWTDLVLQHALNHPAANVSSAEQEEPQGAAGGVQGHATAAEPAIFTAAWPAQRAWQPNCCMRVLGVIS